MTELKTLKDLRSYADPETEDIVPREDLKQEAIKWIKVIDLMIEGTIITDGRMNDDQFRFIMEQKQKYGAGMKIALISFFNITDEELENLL